MQIVLTVGGMTCNHCKASVEEALGALDGVAGAEADLGSGKVTVRLDEGAAVERKALEEAVFNAGFDVE